jgi:hypothetical protein
MWARSVNNSKRQRDMLYRWFKKDPKSVLREMIQNWKLYVERSVTLNTSNHVLLIKKEIEKLTVDQMTFVAQKASIEEAIENHQVSIFNLGDDTIMSHKLTSPIYLISYRSK